MSYKDLLYLFKKIRLSKRGDMCSLINLLKLARGKLDSPESLGDLCFHMPQFHTIVAHFVCSASFQDFGSCQFSIVLDDEIVQLSPKQSFGLWVRSGHFP